MRPDLTRAQTILGRDPLQNAYPLLRIRQNQIADCEIIGSSLRLLDAENGKYLYYAASPQEFRALYAPVREQAGPCVSLLPDDRLASALPQMDSRIRFGSFYQLLAPENMPLQAPAGFRFTPMEPAYFDWVLSVYQHPELNPAFLAARAHAPSALAFYGEDRQPAGFIMSHCDAELGPVYVAPEFRGSGLARYLLALATAGFAARGTRPVIYVRQDNPRSLRFLQKAGCPLCARYALWFWRE